MNSITRTESQKSNKSETIKVNPKKAELQIEIGNLAAEIINKANHSIPIRCSRCNALLNYILQISFLIFVVSYVML